MADEVKQYISRVKLLDGNAYEIKDIEARSALEVLFSGDLIFDGGTAVIDEDTTTSE